VRSGIALGIDRRIGRSLEEAVRAHHRRRLARVGWEHALDPDPHRDWATGKPDPRPGNAVEILVDGAEAFPRIADALRGAASHVHLAGWYFSPDLQLGDAPGAPVLRNLLAELAERIDVRVLVWAGAPLPLFRPSRRQVREMRTQLCADNRIRCALDARERPLHCHHEKIVVVDDHIAFVGGIDLTSYGGDRLDTSGHPSRAATGWHDATSRIEGPAAADVAEHFSLRWREVTGEALPEPQPTQQAGDVEIQVVRTVPEGIYEALPRGDFRILEWYVRALRGAERLIYLENQFLWSPEIVSVLAAKLRDPPRDEFRILVVLPARANNGQDDTRGMLAELIEADAGAGRILPCTLYARAGPHADPVYVHAKIAIVDDRLLTIGSANLNEHSLFNDTEMNVVANDPGLAREARLGLWAEHLELPLEEVAAADPVALVDEVWRPIAEEQHRRRQCKDRLTHRLSRLPHVSRRSARLKGPLNGLLVDG
jgi:phosphatidylserine/phosphatidylglycerophosphate/cardiolipin synthase-like enzyme